MPRATATVSFQAIELKGSLLPASLLEQVARLQAPQQKEADYGLAKGERLREQIDAAWVRLKEIWEEYRDLRERAAQSTAGLHLAQRLLREVLGWTDLQPCSGWQHGDSHFPITHRAFAEPQAHAATSQGTGQASLPLILRGIPADQLDKGSSAFGQEGRRRSPHSCLQECLNADDSANWGLLLSGDRLRLLHDNPSLVKPAYLQVDLELLVEGELFDEFATLWLLLHASRFCHPQTGSCVLDTWKEQAQEAGERVLGQLRHGVQQALEALGNGLLQHPDNDEMRTQLASGALSGAELHRQLLRLVYRFLFLFTAEDRDLLFPRSINQDDARRRIYREGYSVGRLRELAIRRSASEGPYGDLWQTQKLVFLQLRQSSSPLGLPGVGGLFNAPQCQAVEACELGNRFLLRAMRAIGWFQAGDTLTRVNYRDLNTEELGSVYEGLLELHPQLERSGGSWQLSYGGGAGSDRKTTGSYYTPDQLVQLLIVSALLPVIANRLSKATTREEKEAALLAIRVLDPACGSGHFLLAAARRLALELARIRAEDEEPSEELRQQCLRDVVAQCIYGVDKNPMAVELCKVALWIEAVEPGKPLSFLDAHIQCGDSLVGVFDPKVLEQGIPDEAYKPLTGDDRTVCTSLKRENATYRKASKGSSGGLQGSLNLSSTQPSSQSQNRLHEIEAMPEDSLAESTAKQEAYASWLQEAGSDPEQLAADLFTAAFFLPKTGESRASVPTTEHLLKLQLGKSLEDESLIQAVIQSSRDFQFFHWHLRFGEVMERGGFDCILGNPPFINAIEDSDSLVYKGFTRYTYRDLGGTADLGYLFLSQMTRLRSRSGMVGCVQPRAILNAKSAEGLRSRNGSDFNLNMIYSPNKADFFEGASVFICLLVLGDQSECKVSTDVDSSSLTWQSKERIPTNWWQALTSESSEETDFESASDREPLGAAFDVSASMTTGDAYAIKPFLVDSIDGEGLCLVTTGLIDPRKCMWGETPCRYLKEDYSHPRVPIWQGIPKALARRLVKSSRPKIIVAGLSKIVECFVDMEGDFVGAVSTYSIFHPEDSVDALNELCEHLLSPEVSSRFISELGGNAMGGGNITMAKSFLQGLPLPKSLASKHHVV